MNNVSKFFFKDKSPLEFEIEILKLNPKKANLKGDIPTKMLIKTHDIISTYLSRFYNEAKQEN